MTLSGTPPLAILFDLDGTLVDTAPDLAAAINAVRLARGLPATPYAQLRPVASAGARGLIGAAFGIGPDNADYDALRTAFLQNYASALAVHSTFFDGITALLAALEQRHILWGIVTNKAASLTTPFVAQIGLDHAACVISGDTTPHAKPHPAPLLEAVKRINVPAAQCWYVGDDLRDIQAGKAAGMKTLAAGWGYCGATEPASWGADILLDTPWQLMEILRAM